MKGSNSLGRVKKFFPSVAKVVDAQRNLSIEVLANDSRKGKKKAHSECALAVACKRAQNADGVIISRRVAYVIRGNTATRYRVPEYITRELVSFDRGAGFNPGTYTLPKPQKYERLGAVQGGGTGKKPRGLRRQGAYHRTEGVRAVLGAESAAA